MLAFVIRRFVHGVLLLFAASIAVFLLLHLIPGDPALLLAGVDASPAEVKELRDRMGLSRPLPIQYADWLGSALQGDLGQSFVNNLPVSDLIAQRWVPTVQLALAASIVGVLFAIPTGVLAARREGGVTDWAISTFNSGMIAIPAFWMGILAILLFGLYLGWLPAGGYVPFGEDPLTALKFLILPAGVLGLSIGSVLSRYTRGAVREVLHDDHVRTARAKGVPERLVMRHHGLRNALIPITTVFGLQFGGLLGGAVVIEAVFSWPGLGRQVVDAIQARDYILVQGDLLVLTAIYLAVNFLTDVLYGVFDPRIRLDEARGL